MTGRDAPDREGAAAAPRAMSESPFMSAEEIAAFAPTPPGADRRAPLRDALRRHGRYHGRQTAGRFHPGSCVALEVTQRCNLDCTLCYLSEAAEMAHDPPLDLLLSRIDTLAGWFGPGANVQLTGGDPTLRRVEDLEALCARIRAHGMRACLMTNGIKASRAMLGRLAKAGLNDVAFHVDLTQERAGYASERALNAVRLDYLARARGLGLRVLFNTTVFDGNKAELPLVARFFRDHADEVTLASFQMQADTGRGVLRARGEAITQESVAEAIEAGFGAPLGFGAAAVGHEACNMYAAALVAGPAAAAILSDEPLLEAALGALEAADDGADAYIRLRPAVRRAAMRRPFTAIRALVHGAKLLWRLRRGLVRGRAPRRISVLIHNFMDAKALERDRCESCVFTVATEEGPLSMCVHNARRDHHLFTPAKLVRDGAPLWWSAATGEAGPSPELQIPDLTAAPLKRLKGRERATRLANHPNRRTAGAKVKRPEPAV